MTILEHLGKFWRKKRRPLSQSASRFGGVWGKESGLKTWRSLGFQVDDV
jgi:hypothetical protein